MGDVGDQVAHLPLDLGHGGHEPRGMGGLGETDVEAHVGPPVLLEGAGGRLHPLGVLVEAIEVGGGGPLGGQHRRARLHGHPVIEGRARPSPSSTPVPIWPIGGASATKVPPARPRNEMRCPLWTSVVRA